MLAWIVPGIITSGAGRARAARVFAKTRFTQAIDVFLTQSCQGLGREPHVGAPTCSSATRERLAARGTALVPHEAALLMVDGHESPWNTCCRVYDRGREVEAVMRTPVVLSWSGGKDSAMALYELRRDQPYQVVELLTSVADEYRRVSHHGVREILLDAQADALGLPLQKVYLPAGPDQPCTNQIYERIMGEVMARYRAQGVETVAFGDLFLEDLRAYRERNLAKVEMRGVFPLWQRDTTMLAREVIALGFRSYLSCVDSKVGAGFAGRPYDEDLLAGLPPGIDPCGEHGEFHTFVYDGPIFRRRVAVRVGDIVTRDGRHYADLLPADDKSPARRPIIAEIPPV